MALSALVYLCFVELLLWTAISELIDEILMSCDPKLLETGLKVTGSMVVDRCAMIMVCPLLKTIEFSLMVALIGLC